MFKVLVFVSMAAGCWAYSGYGYGGGDNGIGGGGDRGYGGGDRGYGGGDRGYGGYGNIPAAISSRRTVEIKPVHLPQDPIYAQVLEVAPLELPIQIIYNSKSSPVHVRQNHIRGAPGQVEKTSSEEEPHKVIHEVLRPVIQEVREVITPYRRVVQEIQPVIETVNTIVAKGERTQSGRIEGPVGGGGGDRGYGSRGGDGGDDSRERGYSGGDSQSYSGSDSTNFGTYTAKSPSLPVSQTASKRA